MIRVRKWVAAGFGGPEMLRLIETDVQLALVNDCKRTGRACG